MIFEIMEFGNFLEFSKVKIFGSYAVFYFRIIFLFLYLFQLFENSKYAMIIYEIGNLRNFEFVKL